MSDRQPLNARNLAAHLNRECFCITLDQQALCDALVRDADDPEFCATLIQTRPHLFSNTPLFLQRAVLTEMEETVRAIEAVAQLEPYRQAVRRWAPATAHRDFGPRGVFMGYDFHLADDGPRLIEINTNAGGAFLNAFLARAQRACCEPMEGLINVHGVEDFNAACIAGFISEWRAQGRQGEPARVAIADDDPQQQYLYPEFILAQRMFRKHGIDAVIADAVDLRYENGVLWAGDQPIDLVYNRLVDFSLEQVEHAALREAYLDDAVVVTPNPHVHALFADKRNLTLLSDPALLENWGVAPAHLRALRTVPHTEQVTPEKADALWAQRRKLFFKPVSGYASKAVYRGDKLTRTVWSEIIKGGYVAQAYTPPSERTVTVDGVHETCKADVRLFVYDGQVLLTAARLYRGQTTNFRTPGGGFAPVFVL